MWRRCTSMAEAIVGRIVGGEMEFHKANQSTQTVSWNGPPALAKRGLGVGENRIPITLLGAGLPTPS